MSATFDFYPHVAGFMAALNEIYRISGTVLFILCALSASTMFNQLTIEIETHKTSRTVVSSFLKWKDTHAVTCRFVDWINRCFGPVLLIDSACIFIRIIMAAFQAFMELREKKVSRLSMFQTMHTLELFFQFLFMCAVAGRLRIKVFIVLLNS